VTDGKQMKSLSIVMCKAIFLRSFAYSAECPDLLVISKELDRLMVGNTCQRDEVDRLLLIGRKVSGSMNSDG